MLQKVQFQFAAQRKAGCLSGSTLSDGNTVHMCSDWVSMEAGKEEVGRTRQAYRLTVVPQNVHDENHSCPL